MHKEALINQLDNLLEEPSEEALQKFLKKLKREIHDIPLCPKCGGGDVSRKGFNPRKIGPEQQYWCKSCNHIYIITAIESGKRKKKYPNCKKCGGRVKRSGFWRWKTKDGQEKSNQRYECTDPKCGAFFSLKKETP